MTGMENKSNLPRVGDEPESVLSPAPPSLDIDAYLPMIADIEITEHQKREFLETLWSIMCHFVDMGFGVDSLLLIFPELTIDACEAKSGRLSSIDKPNTDFKDAAADDDGQESEHDVRRY